MAAATKKQIQLIYVIGNKCGLVDPGNKQDKKSMTRVRMTRSTGGCSASGRRNGRYVRKRHRRKCWRLQGIRKEKKVS